MGKLIAHAPVCPKIIPFAHTGMDNLLPQDPQSGRTYLNLFGSEPLHVRIKFGKEIHMDDLIDEFESKHGKLWKYDSTSDHCTEQNNWESSDNEKQLYQKIALRIEQELEKITNVMVLKE